MASEGLLETHVVYNGLSLFQPADLVYSIWAVRLTVLVHVCTYEQRRKPSCY